MTRTPERACAVIALIGAPNAGKSTLVNLLVGQKVSIVTHKVQTTRVPLRGITIAGDAQLIFIDTPGIFDPRKRLERAMVSAAWGGARDADLIVLVVDASSPQRIGESLAIADSLEAVRQPCALALNKIDLIQRSRLLEIAAEFNSRHAFDRTFMISALTGDGVDSLKEWLVAEAPKGPWMFPEDQLTDMPLRLMAAEITREKLFLRLHDELPYALSVEPETWTEQKDGSIRIAQVIYVQRESQRRIMLGKGGRTIRAVSIEAREEIAAMLERPVHLFLFVKVRPKWADDRARYREIGLDYEPDR